MGDLPPEAVWRTRWPHMPVRRGRRYLYWASSTCKRPSLVRARWAKMSKIRPARSMTWTPISSVSTRCWEGESSLSKTTRSASWAWTRSVTSATLPSPMKVRVSRFWRMMPTLSPPAVSTRAASSSRVVSLALSSRGRLSAFSPTRTARFLVSWVLWSVIGGLLLLGWILFGRGAVQSRTSTWVISPRYIR